MSNNEDIAAALRGWSQRLLQFSNGAGAGGIFLGEPEPDEDSMSNSTDGNNSNTDLQLNRAVDIGLGILVGFGIILSIVLGTYIMSVVCDNYLCCCPFWRPVTPIFEEDAADDEDGPTARDYGAVTRKAGLFGLLQSERAQLVEYLFPAQVWAADDEKSNESIGESDGRSSEKEKELKDNDKAKAEEKTIENPPSGTAEKSDSDGKQSAGKQCGEDDDANKGAAANSATPAEEDQPVAVEGNNSNNVACCSICLTAYQEGDRIMRSGHRPPAPDSRNDKDETNNPGSDSTTTPVSDKNTTTTEENATTTAANVPSTTTVSFSAPTTAICGHYFHYECCRKWLLRHDECPYCRQEFMTAAEWRQAAVHVLGQARIDELRLQRMATRQQRQQGTSIATGTATVSGVVAVGPEVDADDTEEHDRGVELRAMPTVTVSSSSSPDDIETGQDEADSTIGAV